MPGHARQLHSPSPEMDVSSPLWKAEMRLLESAKASSNTFTCSSVILFPTSWQKPLEKRGIDCDHSSARPGWEPGMILHNLDKHFFPRLHGACSAMGKGFAELLHSIPCKKDPGREIMFSHCFPNYFKCQLKRLLRFLFQTEVLTGTARGS